MNRLIANDYLHIDYNYNPVTELYIPDENILKLNKLGKR